MGYVMAWHTLSHSAILVTSIFRGARTKFNEFVTQYSLSGKLMGVCVFGGGVQLTSYWLV